MRGIRLMTMKNPLDILGRVKRFITEDIWNLDIEDFSRAKARSIKYLKVLIITIKTFSAEKIGFPVFYPFP